MTGSPGLEGSDAGTEMESLAPLWSVLPIRAAFLNIVTKKARQRFSLTGLRFVVRQFPNAKITGGRGNRIRHSGSSGTVA